MTRRPTYDEFTFIKWLRQQIEPAGGVLLGAGDDAAQVECSAGSYLVTTDMLLEGTHFTESAGWRLIGRKAMAVSLSDMAAMAAKPRYAVCATGLSNKRRPEDARKLFQGLKEIADDFGCQIVGGDLCSWPEPSAICTTIFGEPTGNGPVTRSGAVTGDRILVTGELGGSNAGKHLQFLPRVIEAIYLNQNYELHSCIDISDGLGLDLSHILEESSVGAIIYSESVPISKEAARAAEKSGKIPLEHALSDGEDFELLFTMSPEEAERLLVDREFGTKVSVIGGITGGGYVIQGAGGKVKQYKPEGYAHFRKQGKVS
jgi:thiamine-monophosphate kinase